FAIDRYDETLRGYRRSASKQVHKEATPRPRNSPFFHSLFIRQLQSSPRIVVLFLCSTDPFSVRFRLDQGRMGMASTVDDDRESRAAAASLICRFRAGELAC